MEYLLKELSRLCGYTRIYAKYILYNHCSVSVFIFVNSFYTYAFHDHQRNINNVNGRGNEQPLSWITFREYF